MNQNQELSFDDVGEKVNGPRTEEIGSSWRDVHFKTLE